VDLRLSVEDRRLRAELRAVCRERVPADVREAERARRELTKDEVVRSQRALNAAGLAVPHWPVEWGGRDWTPLQRHLWHEELQLAGVPIPYGLNTTMAGPVIAEFGTDEQKRRFLPATANLDIWWAQGFSEPGAGSDLAAVATTAVRDGDVYLLNGQKTWTTYAPDSDWMFTLVRTDPAAPERQAGLSFLLVDMTLPGITVRPIELVDGSREVNEVFLDDVRVPVADRLGPENAGWSIAKCLLGDERVGAAPVAATKVLLETVRAVAPGDPRLVELETELLAVETTALRVAADSADGRAQPASSILKLVGTELRQRVTELALELAGTRALDPHDPTVSEWARTAGTGYLNYRKASIYGGSSEIQRTVIASSILGLGR
jgi:alkylation response protein AidB-like acyl-CoA dehydrogenase